METAMGNPPDYRVYEAPRWQVGPATVDVPPAIAGILQTLPHPGTHWPDVEKARFMAALGAVLDLIYPECDSASSDPTSGDSNG